MTSSFQHYAKESHRRTGLWFVALCLSLFVVTRGFALDPNKGIYQYNCQTWSREHGLPVNGIHAIAQTGDGCIWLGAIAGLLRFDGIKFTVVGMEQSPELRTTQVLALAPSAGGGLWFGLKDSAYGFYDGHGRWLLGRDAQGKTDWSVASIMESKDGRVWIGGNSASIRSKNDPKVQPLFTDELRGVYVSSLLEDSRGRIWAGTTDKGLYYLDPNQKKWLKHPDAALESMTVTAVAEDKEGGMWVGTPNGPFHFDAQGRRQIATAPGYHVQALLVDRHGVLWEATQGGGLWRHNAGQWMSLRATNGLADDYVIALAEDREGSIWAGTRNGLTQLTDVKLTTFGLAEGLPSEMVLSVSLSPRSGVWASTRMGVCRFEGLWASETYSTNSGMKMPYVKRALESRNGDIYALNGMNEINIFAGGKWLARHPTSAMPVAMMEDRQGVVVSVGGEIFRVGRDYLTPYLFTNGFKPELYWVINLAAGRDDSILIASVNGICRIKGGAFEQWKQADGLADYNARWICDDADGTLWAGLATGIARIRGREIRNIRRENGLFDANIAAMVPDDLGNFWVDSNRGIFRVTRASLNAVADGRARQVDCVSFDTPASVKSADKYDQEQTGCRTADGYIWFASSRGLIRIDPPNIPTNTVPPPVHVESVRANGKEVGMTNRIVVPPGAGELEFHYVAFSFVDPQRIQFRYQLEGYDRQWVEAKDRRLAVYNNLKPGHYTFRVIAANSDGVWNHNGEPLTLELRPYFQQTTGFRLLCAGLVLAALAGIYAWRIRNLKSKQQALQKNRDLLETEVVNRTAELARANASLQQEEVQLKQKTQALETEIEERKNIQLEVERVHQKLIVASRQAGMAEIATNVLHNVGNVLNSVNVSAGLIVDSVKKSKASSLTKVVDLMQEHAHDLGAFITNDSRGKHLPVFLAHLSNRLMADQEAMVSELDSLRRNVEHIKEIVAMQQNYASFGGVREIINVVDLVEDSLRMNEGALSRHRVEVIREYENVPPMNIDKHKILQILVNLLRNAKHACQDSDRADKRLTVRVANGEGRIKISVIDNGVGISPENLTRIFNHGFTTRKKGHGFGLHSGALAAKEMGGSLTVHSDGPGQGAAFTLELPLPSHE